MNDSVRTEGVRGLSRRSVLTAGAWSVPVVLMAVSVPFAAASGALEVVALSGDAPGGQDFVFADVSPEDFVPLVFTVTSGEQDYDGTATATLIDAAGQAEWDESVAVGGSGAAGAVEQGYLFLPLVVHAVPGTFTVAVEIAGRVWNFTVTLVGA